MTVSIAYQPFTGSHEADTAWQALDVTLQQLGDWLATVSEQHYRGEQLAEGLRVPQGQTPGRHTRHIVDHVSALCGAIDSVPDGSAGDSPSTGAPQVDYDQRTRDPKLEQHPKLARLRLEAHRETLRRVAKFAVKSIGVRHEGVDDVQVYASSLQRELIYVAEHAIHHMALINVLMVLQGEQLPTDFGMNPSTLRYQAQVADGSFDVRAS